MGGLPHGRRLARRYAWALHAVALSFAGVFWAPAVWAQADIGGQIARDNQRKAEELLREDPEKQLQRGRPASTGDEERAKPQPGPSDTFLIRKIVLTPSKILSADVTAAIALRHEGKRLTIAQIQGIAREFDDAYVEAEFKAGFALVPNQDLTTGTLQVMLIEPRADMITLSGVSRVKPDYVADRIPLKSGDLLDLSGLERNLNLLNRTSRGGVQLEALLRPGGSFGTTFVDLAAREGPAVEIVAGVDNFGTKETGYVRPLAVVRLNNLLGRDDPFQFGLSDSRDSLSGFASYSVPVINFLRFNVSGSISDSEITRGDVGDLGLVTDAKYLTMSLEHPVFTTDRWMLKAEGGGELNLSHTETGPLDIQRRIREAFAQTHLTYYGDTSGAIATLRAATFEARISDNADTSTDWYSYLGGSVFAYKRMDKFELRLRGEAQWTPDDLLPTTKQFTLGGIYSVRGYESSAFSGDSGFYLGLEGRMDLFTLPPTETITVFSGLDALAFADAGGVFPYRADGSGPKREDFATSVGAGLELAMFNDRLALFAGAAMPLDNVHEPIHQDDARFLFSATLTTPFN